MTKFLCAIAMLLFMFSPAQSQQVLFEKKIDLVKYGREKRRILPVPDDDSGETAFLFVDPIGIKAIHVGSDSTIREMTAPLPEKKYEVLLGAQKRGPEYTIYFSNGGHTDLATITINFENRQFSMGLIPLELEDESYSCSFIYNKKLHFITRLKKEHGFALFTFTKNRFVRKPFTFPENTKDDQTTPKSFYETMWPENTTFIDQVDHGRLRKAHPTTKIYYVDHRLVFTFDNYKDKTIAITLDTVSNQGTIKSYPQENPLCKLSSMYSESNSFIQSNRLFQIFGCQEGLSVRATDLNDGNVLFSKVFRNTDEINFRNTALIAQAATKREIKPAAFIRKVANGRPAVSAYATHDKIVLTVGGNIISSGGGYSAPMQMGGGSVSTPGGTVSLPATTVYTPVSSGSTSSIVYFDVLLAKETLEHIQGDIPTNIHERTTEFLKNLKVKKAVLHKLFYSNGKHYLACYLTDSKTFTVRKLEQ